MTAFQQHFCWTIVLWALLLAMPSAVSAQDERLDSASAVSYEAMRKYEYFYGEYLRQSQAGHHDAAMELLSYCLRLNPESDVALYEMARYHNFLQQDSLAKLCLEKAVRLDPDNYWYSSALVGTYVKESRIDEAIAVVESLSRKFPKKSDVLIMLVDLYTRNEDYKNVIKTLERLEVKEGKSEHISMEKFRIYVQMKDEKRAYEEIMNLAEEYPNDLRYRVILGDMYVKHGHMDKAYEVYKAVEAIDSTNFNVMISLSDYYEKTGQDSIAGVMLDRILLDNRLDNSIRLQFMTTIISESIVKKSDSTEVLSKFRKIMTLPQETADMADLYVRYMVTIGMPEDSISPVLRTILEIDPENHDARAQLLTYAIDRNDTAAVYQVCKSAIDISIKNPIYYYFAGIVYFQRDDYSSAIDVLNKGLAYADERTSIEIVAKSYGLLGDLYHSIGDDEMAFEAYDSCLIYTPDDISVLNNYAYYLSLKDAKLEEAEQMSAKTLVAEPDNATYVDTYAWILFKLKRYEEARTHIDKAMELLGDSITSDDSNIVEHAGDIYAKCGNTDEAVRLWTIALDLGCDSATLPKKIKKKKYIAE